MDFQITDDDDSLASISSIEECESPFTVIVDSREQRPYTFQNIIGDSKDSYANIKVKTIRKGLVVADYSILEVPGIAIERKSKEDLFSSIGTTAKRENFLGRLAKMQTELEFGAVVIECNIDDMFEAPEHSSLSPKIVFRTALSWEQQFPLVHWHWYPSREWAEQATYRILEKFWEHKTDSKYVHHNRPIEENIEAFRLGFLSRSTANEIKAPYPVGNQLRSSWDKGWKFYSDLFLEGKLGVVHEFQDVKKTKGKFDISSGIQYPSLPGQGELPFDRLGEKLVSIMDKEINKSEKLVVRKKRSKK